MILVQQRPVSMPAQAHAMGLAFLGPPHAVSSRPPWYDLSIMVLCNILARGDRAWLLNPLLSTSGRGVHKGRAALNLQGSLSE